MRRNRPLAVDYPDAVPEIRRSRRVSPWAGLFLVVVATLTACSQSTAKASPPNVVTQQEALRRLRKLGASVYASARQEQTSEEDEEEEMPEEQEEEWIDSGEEEPAASATTSRRRRRAPPGQAIQRRIEFIEPDRIFAPDHPDWTGRIDGWDFSKRDLWLLDLVPDLVRIDFTSSNMTPVAVQQFKKSHPRITIEHDWYFGGSARSGAAELSTSAFSIVFEDLKCHSSDSSIRYRGERKRTNWESKLPLGQNHTAKIRSTKEQLTITIPPYALEIPWDGTRVTVNGAIVDLTDGSKPKIFVHLENGVPKLKVETLIP